MRSARRSVRYEVHAGPWRGGARYSQKAAIMALSRPRPAAALAGIKNQPREINRANQRGDRNPTNKGPAPPIGYRTRNYSAALQAMRESP